MASQLDKAVRACRTLDTAVMLQAAASAEQDEREAECRREIEAVATVIHSVLAEQQPGTDDQLWRAAYVAAGRLLGHQTALDMGIRHWPEPPRQLPAQVPEQRRIEMTPQETEASRRIDALARMFFPILTGQMRSDNFTWAAAYGLAYQIVDLVDVPHSHLPAPRSSKLQCLDAVTARLVGNEIQKYGIDPVLGMLRYMSEYVHKVSLTITDETPRYLTLNGNALLVNPHFYAQEEALFGPIVTNRLNSEQSTSQATLVKLKGLMGKYWDDVQNTQGWGTAIEIKQLSDYRAAVARKWHAPTKSVNGKPLEASACLALPSVAELAAQTGFKPPQPGKYKHP